MVNYQALVQPSVTAWKNECLTKLSVQQAMTIAEMLLLSYQVVQASVAMSQAKLAMQTELLKIVTLSINDTLSARLQAENNDLTAIKQAITTIEQAQEQIKFACNSLKNFGPLIIHIDPCIIQLFIANIKTTILHWAKTQQQTVVDLKEIEKQLITIPELFDDVEAIFTKIYTADKAESMQLIEGTNTLQGLYGTIELMYAHVTLVRTTSIANFNTLLTLYFKEHYKLLYTMIQDVDLPTDTIITINHQILSNPEEIFILA